MYESEANLVRIAGTEIPQDIALRFAESRRTVTSRTLIPWGEHCTECVWPTCYRTCDLYTSRLDGRCRRFVDGIVRIDCPNSLNSYLLKITFKRWAKLWAVGNAHMYSLVDADRAERRDFQIASWIGATPTIVRAPLIRSRYSWKKKAMRLHGSPNGRPNCFLIECYNPNRVTIGMTIVIRREGDRGVFQALLSMDPGFNSLRLHTAEIEQLIDLCSHFTIELTPNEIHDGTTLYFGAIDFVADSSLLPLKPKTSARSTCKCVIWDLDNTLWDGTLVEDGPAALRLKPGIIQLLQALDERGILISAASKNNLDDAIGVLQRMGIQEYFLYPQISWEPKSRGIQRVAAALNIGIDSLLFIDDSAFEREEVASACPTVTVLDAREYRSILDRPDCQLPVTPESRKRRIFYREQERRESAQKQFDGDYTAFLLNCDLRLTIRSLREDNLERAYELTQRTNQMNFSGNRYSREQILQFLASDVFDTYVLDCADKFGSYGTIGFCLVDRPETRITDLMFSCRVQGKRVEHALLSFLIDKYRQSGAQAVFADYRKTKRNAAPGMVFTDLGFEVLSEVDGLTRLVFPRCAAAAQDAIVTIRDLTPPL